MTSPYPSALTWQARASSAIFGTYVIRLGHRRNETQSNLSGDSFLTIVFARILVSVPNPRVEARLVVMGIAGPEGRRAAGGEHHERR